jgi:hypothetical protein
LNIARISYLGKAFPNSTIIILFRSPLQQASSLLKQHRNFSEIHKKDQFSKKYMKDTGHYDFGENLRPIDFKGWFSKIKSPDPNHLSFWLEYWINAYQYQLSNINDRVHFFSFDSLYKNPKSSLEKLQNILKIKNPDLWIKKVARIREPKPHAVVRDNIPSNILNQADDIFAKLKKVASN